MNTLIGMLRKNKPYSRAFPRNRTSFAQQLNFSAAASGKPKK